MEYKGLFAISYKEYCEINNLNEVPETMITKWREDVIHNYSKEAAPNLVMKLFNIPKDHKKAIEYHEYKIEDSGYQIDKTKKVMTVYMTLRITK